MIAVQAENCSYRNECLALHIMLAWKVFFNTPPPPSCLIGVGSQSAGPFKAVKDFDKLDPSKTYMLAWHPHGRVFVGPGIFIGNLYSWFPEFKAAAKHIFLGINDAM
jgi:hypothetical protein